MSLGDWVGLGVLFLVAVWLVRTLLLSLWRR